MMGRTSALAAILRRPATLVIGTAALLTALEGAAVVLPVTLIGWASTLLISLIRRAASLLATLEGTAVVLLAALIGWTSTLLIPLIGGARPFLRIGAGRSWLLGTGCRSRLCLLGLLGSRLSWGGRFLLRLGRSLCLNWFWFCRGGSRRLYCRFCRGLRRFLFKAGCEIGIKVLHLIFLCKILKNKI